MKYSFWLIKEIIIVLFVTSIHLQNVDGRRYDKCETPDGRQGVCVVKRYCREASVQSLEACDNDDNFCCPIPTTHRSAKPPVFLASESYDTRNDYIPESIPNASQDSDHRSVTRDFPSGNQKPLYAHAAPGGDSSSNTPVNSHKVLSSSSGSNRRTVTSHRNPEEPHNTRNDDIPKNIPNASPDSDRRSVTRDFPSGNQRPLYGHDTPGKDSSSNAPVDSHKVLSFSSGGNRRTVTSHHNPEQPHSTRKDDIPRNTHNASPDSDHRSVTRDFPSGNQRSLYDHDTPGEDSSSNAPVDSHKVLSSNNGGNRRTVTSHRNPEQPHSTRNDDIPKNIHNASPDSDHRSVTSDFPSGNQRPVYNHANPGEDSLSNIPIDSHKVLSSSRGDNRRTVTSHHNPDKLQSTRNDDFPKSVPNESQDNDRRSVTRDVHSDKQRPEYGHPNPGIDSLSNVPESSYNAQSSSGGGSRQPITPHHNPEENFQQEIKENRKRTMNSEHPVNHSYIPTPGGRVRFEDAEHLLYDQNSKNRRLKPQSSNSNVRPSDERSEKDSNNRQNSAGPDSAKNNRNVNPKPLLPTAGHYPSRHQLEVQKLPSNPRRLKPLNNDGKNDTFDENVRHTFYPHSQPKVPACGVKPYDLFIAGGETSEAYEWPWMTSIFRRHQGSRPKTFLCGGSLINTKYVLTAAHCFVNNYVVLPASSFVIRLGSHFLDSGEEYTVADLVIHHNHSGSDFFNDIALVKIASEVYITDKIAPICLPTPDMMSYDFVDRMATVAGWGDTAFRTGSSRALQHVTIPIVSGEECFSAYSRVRGAAFLARGSDHVICAGLREGGKDACLGDSGGPLMLKTIDDRWIIVGIVSLGYKCAEPGYPGVYTRVTHYLTWIHANMKPH